MTELILVFIARWLIYLVFTLVILYIWRKFGYKLALRITLITFITWLIGQILKYVFNIPRPLTSVASPLIVLDPSFPSTHTALLVALGTLVFTRNKILGSLILALALVVGAARVILGVHFPVDILGGFVLGVVISLIFAKVLKIQL